MIDKNRARRALLSVAGNPIFQIRRDDRKIARLFYIQHPKPVQAQGELLFRFARLELGVKGVVLARIRIDKRAERADGEAVLFMRIVGEDD